MKDFIMVPHCSTVLLMEDDDNSDTDKIMAEARMHATLEGILGWARAIRLIEDQKIISEQTPIGKLRCASLQNIVSLFALCKLLTFFIFASRFLALFAQSDSQSRATFLRNRIWLTRSNLTVERHTTKVRCLPIIK
jgi:hypothetical protein